MHDVGKGRRVHYVNHNCYLDDSNGAAIASRALMEGLARQGFAVGALTGPVLELGQGAHPDAWRALLGLDAPILGGTWTADQRGVRDEIPPHIRATVNGVSVWIHAGHPAHRHQPGAIEQAEFLRLFEALVARARPDVVVGHGGSRMIGEVFARARALGAATVFTLHNLAYHNRSPFDDVDAVIVPSRFAADHYRRTLGLDCTALPNFIDFERVRPERHEPKYVTFVNPSIEKGVYAFARLADELGRLRPEIPLLVVECRGTEETVAACGLDLRLHGNVHYMGHTPDPRAFWGVTRIVLLPSLCLENQPLVAVEAMLNGIPVIGADRGGIPEALGRSGVVLPLPAWLTPQARALPTAREVAPWIEAVIRLWDDSELHA